MAKKRLDGLSLLAIERESAQKIDLESIVDKFAKANMLDVQAILNKLYLFFVCENLKVVRNIANSVYICVYPYVDIIFAVKMK